jgi:hypothetical protein
MENIKKAKTFDLKTNLFIIFQIYNLKQKHER